MHTLIILEKGAITMNQSEVTFRGTINLQFDNGGSRTKILPEQIVYILIEHDYIRNVLPVIYVCVSVYSSMYQQIIVNKDTARMYLEISCDNVLSSTSVATTSLSGLYTYILNVVNQNPVQSLNNATAGLDSSYQTITLALFSADNVATARKSFNDIYKQIDTSTLIGIALEGTNCLVEPLENNLQFDQFIVPPQQTRYRFLKYIFDYAPFYNTYFRYFIDDDKSYLLSQKGTAFTSRDNTVSVVIDEATTMSVLSNGIQKSMNGIELTIPSTSARYTVQNDLLSNTLNTIVAYNDQTEVLSSYKLNTNSSTDGLGDKKMYVRSMSGNTIKNSLEQSYLTIEILKNNIDGSTFTPEKQYIIRNYGDYRKYDGTFLLAYKRSFYKGKDGGFITSCNLGFNAISSNEPYNAASNVKTGLAQSSGDGWNSSKEAALTNNAMSRSHRNNIDPATGLVYGRTGNTSVEDD